MNLQITSRYASQCAVSRSTTLTYLQGARFHSSRAQYRQLEVERKFLATKSAIEYLRSNGGDSSFKAHKTIGRKTAHDIYYDRNDQLFSKGIYIRQRNGNWEAKVRVDGDFINSAFTEVEGYMAVKEAVKHHLAGATEGLRIEGVLKPCAEFVTERESWVVEGRFKVDVDTTDFGHTVGEVD